MKLSCRGGRLILTILISILALPYGINAQSNSALKEGDFLFLDLDCGGLCDAIEAVTEGVNDQDFSHLGLVHRKGDSIFVLEAMGNSVRLSRLSTFLSYTGKAAVQARLKPEYQKLIGPAIAYGMKQLGKAYDDAFLPDNGKYYCSELVYDAFLEANGGKPFFSLEPMTYRIPGSAEFFPVWLEYYKKLGIPVPESVPGCNPGGLSRSEKLDILGPLAKQKN
jgi:hypothetical protein